jgi:hypothetical protein
VAERLAADADWLQLAIDVEDVALRLLAEHKPDRPLKTNVEYYASIVLDGVGLLTDLSALRLIGSKAFGSLELIGSVGPLFDWHGQFATAELSRQVSRHGLGRPAARAGEGQVPSRWCWNNSPLLAATTLGRPPESPICMRDVVETGEVATDRIIRPPLRRIAHPVTDDPDAATTWVRIHPNQQLCVPEYPLPPTTLSWMVEKYGPPKSAVNEQSMLPPPPVMITFPPITSCSSTTAFARNAIRLPPMWSFVGREQPTSSLHPRPMIARGLTYTLP